MTDFSKTRAFFDLPKGVIYMDGNSLGPLPRTVPERLNAVARAEWGQMVITGWNRAGWMTMPRRIGDRLGSLIGAEKGTVVVGDTLSIKVYQALASALEMRPDRKVILSDTGNFPSDLYMTEGLIRSLGQGHELRLAEPGSLEDAISDDLAVLLVTEVDYRTGRRHNMQRLIDKAHRIGALVIWDLAHSAGAFPVNVSGLNADFAVGCTYKYLNAGPGAPAFIYVAPRHAHIARPALAGWMGHDAPFDFELGYRPGDGIDRMRVGTPPILQMASLDAALDVWDDVDLDDVRARSIELSEIFISEVETSCPEVSLASPRAPENRGSQVGLRFEHGYAAMQALIARGVIGDFRAPDIMRFGFTPLYLTKGEVREAARILADIIATRAWDNPDFQRKDTVT